MLVVQFSGLRLVEYPDTQTYTARAGQWLAAREAENCYLLGALPQTAPGPRVGGEKPARYFALEDRENLVAAAILFPGDHLCTTWATPEMITTIVDGLLRANVQIASVYGPAHVSGGLARTWVQRTGQRFEYDRDERVYQLVRLRYEPPATGRLEPATAADKPLVTEWLEAFSREAKYEMAHQLAAVRDALIGAGRLFLWKNPEPVAMASWVNPTPHGACINLVYTPEAERGRGHGKAVCAALGARMLASGLRYCFILTDTTDKRTNHLYQSIGARTVAELLRCVIQSGGPRFAVGAGGQVR